MKHSLVIFCVALLAGCAPATFAELRKNPGGTATLEVSIPYEQAYRIIVRETRRCFDIGSSGASLNVTGDIYAESKAAEVTVGWKTVTANIAELAIEIQALTENRTAIQAIYRKEGTANTVRAMKAWLAGDTTTCSVSA